MWQLEMEEKGIDTISISSEENEEELKQLGPKNENGEVNYEEAKEEGRVEESIEEEQKEMRASKWGKMLRVLRYQIQAYDNQTGLKIQEDGGWVRQEFINSFGVGVTRGQCDGLAWEGKIKKYRIKSPRDK